MSFLNKTAVIIVTFNISNLIEKQIELIKKFCKDDHDIIVVDNSNNLNVANDIKNIVNSLNCNYLKTNSPSDFSESHAAACNFAYKQFRKTYKYILLLDHDNFPTEDFKVSSVIIDKVIGGTGQKRGAIYYYWPGCLMINNELIDTDMVDFSTNPRLSLDTGGNLYKIVEKYKFEKCVNFDQYEIYDTNDINYGFYNNICAPSTCSSKFTFMHFINASNWNNKENNETRINRLLGILNERIK